MADPVSFDTCDTSPTRDPECRSSWSVPDDDPLLRILVGLSIALSHFVSSHSVTHHEKTQAVALLRGVQSAARLLVLIPTLDPNQAKARGVGTTIGQAVKTPLAASSLSHKWRDSVLT